LQEEKELEDQLAVLQAQERELARQIGQQDAAQKAYNRRLDPRNIIETYSQMKLDMSRTRTRMIENFSSKDHTVV
jgi:hypothetical protein